MESLLANYASSDEEEQEQPLVPNPSSSSKPSSEHGESTSSKAHSLFSALPQPKSSSLFQSLPQPKQSSGSRNALTGEDDSETGSGSIPKSSSVFSSLPQPKNSSINTSSAAAPTMSSDIDGYEADSISTYQSSERTSLFSSLPKPKSQIERETAPRVSASGPSTKKVIQFRPPIIPLKKSGEVDDDEEEDERKAENERKRLEPAPQTSSVKSFLSSIPAPRNSSTLGVQATSGSGRRSIIETDAPASNADGSAAENNVNADLNGGSYASYESHSNYQYGTDQNPEYYMDSNSYGNYSSGIDHCVGGQPEAGTASTTTPASYYVNNDAYTSYNAYGDHAQYGNNWADGYGASVPEMSGMSDSGAKVSGKRGRSEIPSEIIEVKQEELIKNRPREDQGKLTGIAFGPSYQPVSAKGKPSKLHRRKHQIGSLYFDMKQKESELTERRAKGMLTKAETQAKYGW